jgi:hypothetical protein
LRFQKAYPHANARHLSVSRPAPFLFVLPVQYAGEQRHVICEPRNVDGNESIVPLALLIGSEHVNGFDFGDFSSFVGADEP